MMTTMAALLGRRAAGAWAAAWARNCAGRWASRSSADLIFSQVLTLYTTPVIYLAFDRLAERLRTAQAADERRAGDVLGGGAGMSLSTPFIHRPVGTTLLTVAITLAGVLGLFAAAGVAAAGGRFSHDPGLGQPARRQSRNDGLGRGDAAGAAVRPDRRRHRDDLDQLRSARRRSRCSSI